MKFKAFRGGGPRSGFYPQVSRTRYLPGRWYKSRSHVELGRSGYHCALRVLTGLRCVSAGVITTVETGGDFRAYPPQWRAIYDIETWREMRITKAWKWTGQDTVSLSLYSAAQVRDLVPGDERVEAAFNLAHHWRGNQEKAKMLLTSFWEISHIRPGKYRYFENAVIRERDIKDAESALWALSAVKVLVYHATRSGRVGAGGQVVVVKLAEKAHPGTFQICEQWTQQRIENDLKRLY